MVELSSLIRVTTRIAASGVPRLAFGRGLLVTTDAALSGGGSGKVRLFESASEAGDALTAGGAALDAVNVWFSADPQPQGLYVGRWANVDVATSLRGTPTVVTGTAPFVAATVGTFRFNGLDASVAIPASPSYANIAGVIATAINALAGISSATFTYAAATGFTLTLSGGDPINPPYLEATGAGTDISAALGMDAASDPTYVLGSNAETIAQGVAAMIDRTDGGVPVAVMLADDAPLLVGTADTRNDLADYAEATGLIFALLETDERVEDPAEVTSHAYRAFNLQLGNVAAVYGLAGEKPDVGLMALLSAQNLDQPASIISPHTKTMPGVAPVTGLTTTAREALEAKRVNVYTRIGRNAALYGGWASRSGYWLDAVWWNRWLKAQIETSVWDSMRRSRRFTRALLFDALAGVMQSAVRNGGLQGGRTVSAATRADVIATTGNRAFNGRLEAGWIVWVDNSPSLADRESRMARFKVWGTGSDAVHEVDGDVIFEN